jgi:hypothetical protein
MLDNMGIQQPQWKELTDLEVTDKSKIIWTSNIQSRIKTLEYWWYSTVHALLVFQEKINSGCHTTFYTKGVENYSSKIQK